ncbi:ANP32A_C_D [Lepeophtheirus salmonis]|uniref:ANP32A_C_D n=1 Tax=Lepeophtheirus salmonis TaxID=72036 RepID=A0A7R8HAT6_LEPSM|nr:ANP32A_C_D [Lepeophtheirus salmonis]CAF2971583.1 ANP32A_C_D [Lepeophtheirus salmonis]
MEKRIELERRGKDPSEITELNLDNSRATQIEGLTDEYSNLASLSLISVGLTTLKGFSLPSQVEKVGTDNNRIKDLETLEPLKSFKNMTHLDLFNNDVCKIEDYRTKVFEFISNLKFLDGYDVDENEAEESDSESYDGVNGGNINEEDEDDDEEDGDGDEEVEEEEEDDEGEYEDEGPGLASIYNTNFNDIEDGDYQCNDEDEEEDLEEEEDNDEENSDAPKGKRRKLEDEGDGGGGEDKN